MGKIIVKAKKMNILGQFYTLSMNEVENNK